MINLHNNEFVNNLTLDMAEAENLQVPGIAKHHWVVARQIQRYSKSPPPTWVWLLVTLLEKVIPIVLEWLRKNYGDSWPAKVRQNGGSQA